MKSRRCAMPAVLLLVLCLAGPSALAAGDGDRTSLVETFSKVLTKEKTAKMIESVTALKEAGLSYQESLVAGQKDVVDCKDQHQLQVLVGVYLVDASYARCFAKSAKTVATFQFTERAITERLEIRQKVKVLDATTQEILKRFADGPVDEAAVQAVADMTRKNLEAMIEKARTDPAVMDYFLNRVFGGVVELTYLACKLALGAPRSDKIIALFNKIAGVMDDELKTFESAKDPLIQTVLRSKERTEFLRAAVERIARKSANLDAEDLKFILEKVEPIRNSLIARCK